MDPPKNGEEKSEKDSDNEFRKTLNETLERLRKLPTTAEEMKLPIEQKSLSNIYIKLCNALKVPVCSIFLSSIESESMDLSYQCVGPLGIIAVTKALIPCQTVKDLNLSYNQLGPKSLRYVTSLLNNNENITRLNLRCNEINKSSADQLRDLISACHSVEFLDLAENNLGDEEFMEIAAALAKIDRTKELNLSRNDAGPDCGLVFGSLINKCSALEKLDLSHNHFETGAAGLFGTFKKSNLKLLDFSHNGINDMIIPDIAKGLRANKTLQVLDLSSNHVTNKGIVDLSPAFKKCSTLEVLQLNNNPFHGPGASAVLNSIGENMKLLDLSGIKGNLNFEKTMAKYKKSGRAVKVLYGSKIRHDLLPRDYRQQRDDSIDESNALVYAQRLADEKGLSLKNVFKGIHASFLVQKTEEASQSADEDTKKDDKDEVRKMSVDDFAKGLMSSPLAPPKAISVELANALSVDETVNLWDVIPRIKWRPDDLAAKAKVKKQEPPPKKSKDKKKKK
ncbi:Leucine-rich repeat-containing protein 74A [Araneus ventricosus]|uniref:Leucine-rich repeat-containing protein 74A n=1 Tax=Araneus ventricosus TaxID=182803 RepID=A0A4Y2K738_ARAVE|nr:Leucine-rich repeat-containing protein 74A [Araneus ventricosus]